MASRKRAGRKSSSVKKTENVRKNRKEKSKQNSVVREEIILIITMAISVLLFLFFFDVGGPLGKYVSKFLFGMIGLLAYVLPFALFFGVAFYLANRGNSAAGRKIMSAIVFFIALASIIQLITVPYDPEMKIYEYYLHSSGNRIGGGIIGGILVMILCSISDITVAYIILAAIMLISLIVITGRAIFLYIAKKSKHSLEARRANRQLRKEQLEQERLRTVEEENARGGLARSANTQEGRAWKAFEILDGKQAGKSPAGEGAKSLASTAVNAVDRNGKRKTDYDIDDLPLVNLDHLFPPESDVHMTGRDEKESVKVPTYEDELREKFGRSRTSAAGEGQEGMPHKPAGEATGVEKRAEKSPAEKTVGSTGVEDINIPETMDEIEYVFPPMKLLSPPRARSGKGQITERTIKETAIKLQNTLESFGVHVTVTNVSVGPTVTRYELQPEQGVKVKSITSLADDIKLNLAAPEVRIEAPIPGKSAVGIEVPNKENYVVTLREILESKEFTEHPSDIAFAVGRDIGGQIVVGDIAKMPHLLIAGATGSGKSVCINPLIISILYKSSPADVRMIMIDPKVVELNVYNGIPHLLIPVVTDPKKAAAALNWAVVEMTNRYKKFAEAGVRDLVGYNEKARELAFLNDEKYQKIPQIVIIIDELSDLMMVAPSEVEDAICRLAQMARAAGIHLIIATQRPSVNVITGLIKANIPSRIAFAVSSQIDSRTIIDGAGAEKLLGKGDMLFFPTGYPKPVRIQGAYVSDKEVGDVVDFLVKNNSTAKYSEEINETIANMKTAEAAAVAANERDDYFVEAGRYIIEKDKASIGMLQRVYKIGFNRAARIMDQLAEAGVVGPEEGTKPRKILMTMEEYEQFLIDNNLV